jgi:hypothetical protein
MYWCAFAVDQLRPILQARDHVDSDAVALGDVSERFTSITAPDGFGALIVPRLRLRLNFTPSAIARLRPSPVRSRIGSRSNPAMPAASIAADLAPMTYPAAGRPAIGTRRRFCRCRL